MNIPEALTHALTALADRLADCPMPWLVGGSSGLLLQEVRLAAVPRDLDVYSDEPSSIVHERLAPLSLDQPEYSRTERYSSTLSHYSLNGITVELVGGFRVKVPEADYTVRIADQILAYAPQVAVGGRQIRLMPLAHELLFNMLRERPDRYQAIAERMRADRSAHLSALRALIGGNRFGESWIRQASELLGLSTEDLLNHGVNVGEVPHA